MKRIGREPVEVNINAPQSGHVPIYDAENGLWNTISSSSLLSNTASFAISASQAQDAISASHAIFATTSSFANDFTVKGTLTAQTIVVQVITSSTELVTGSLTVSGSLNALGGVTGSLYGTSSWAEKAISASYSLTASFVPGAVYDNQTSSLTVLSSSFASTASFVNNLNQQVTISGSLSITGSIFLSSSLHATLGGVAQSGVNTSIIIIPTQSYSAAFFEYTINSGSNARAGNIAAVFKGNDLKTYDNSTLDIGDTSTVDVYVGQGGGNIDFIVFPSAGNWNVKAIYRLI